MKRIEYVRGINMIFNMPLINIILIYTMYINVIGQHSFHMFVSMQLVFHLLGDNLVVIVFTWFKDSLSGVCILLVMVHKGLHVVYAYRLSPMVF